MNSLILLLQILITVSVYHHASSTDCSRRLRPDQLRSIRRSPLHHHQRHGTPLHALHHAKRHEADKSKLRSSDNVLHHLCLFSNIPLLRESRGSWGRTGDYFNRHTCVYGHHWVEE